MKNPINVIDQELIDYFYESIDFEDDFTCVYAERDKLKQLVDMAKELIQTNAELTKENQKLLNKK